jgi:GDP-4-dehydro-6-deoxy-D-mannose reductase
MQEQTALAASARAGVPVVVTRSFNHTGPGQRRDFVAPALAERVVRAKRTGSMDIPVGNLDVRRDLGDVRDFTRAYRLLLEGLVSGSVETGTVVNIGTGRAISIRELLQLIAEAADASIRPVVDEALVRTDDPPLIVADASKVRGLVGWAPEIPLERTIRDLVASLISPTPRRH